MNKRLRIIIPSLQVAAFIATFALKFAVERGSVQFNYTPLQELTWAVNYPIWMVLQALADSGKWLPDAWGWLSLALGIAFGILLVPVVAMLWYFIVAEFEMRTRGRSMIRFSSRVKESVTIALLMLFGCRSLYEAYIFRSSLVDTGLYQATVRSVEMACRLVLVAWGVVLIGLVIYDLVVFLKWRERGAAAAVSPK